MGVDFHIGCGNCCEFIDLHKWPVVDDAGQFLVHAHYEPGQYPSRRRLEDSPYPFADLGTHCKKVIVTSDQIECALASGVPDQPYIRKLTRIVQAFAVRHRGHRVFLSCDLGDPAEDPWWPGRLGFAEWLELPGPFRFSQYLPRNLIELARYQSWSAVLAGMAQEWPFKFAESHQEEIEAIRAGFEERRSRCST